MKAVILNAATAADTAERLLRKAHGIPHAADSGTTEGLVQVGGGGHVPAEQAKTVRVARILKHPTNAQWAVLLRDEVVEQLTSARAEGRLTLPLLDPISGNVLVPARLTQAEYTTIKTRLATAVDVTPAMRAAWSPPVER